MSGSTGGSSDACSVRAIDERGLVQARVLDRGRGAQREVLDEPEVHLVEPPARLGDTNEITPSTRSRSRIGTSIAERRPTERMSSRCSASARRLDEHLVGDLRIQLGDPVAQHAVDARCRCAGRAGSAPASRAPARPAPGRRGRPRRARARAVAGEVDRAPVGDLRHRQPGDRAQRLLQSSESASTRLASARNRCASSARLSSVMSSITLIASRRCRARRAPGVDWMRDQRSAARRGTGSGRSSAAGARRAARAGREAPRGERLPVLGEHLEAAPDLPRRRGEHLLGAGEPEQPDGGLVRIDEPAVGGLGGDGVGDALEDRAEVVARLAQRREEARVVDRERAAVGELLGARRGLRARPSGRTRPRPARCRRSPCRAHAAARPSRRPSRPRAGSAAAPGRSRRPAGTRPDIADQLRLARPDHLRRADRRVRVERIALVVLDYELALGRVDVLHDDALDAAVAAAARRSTSPRRRARRDARRSRASPDSRVIGGRLDAHRATSKRGRRASAGRSRRPRRVDDSSSSSLAAR